MLSAPLLTINSLYINSSHYRSMNGLYKFENVPHNIQIANMGSSHGRYGITYDQMQNKICFNFALDSQPLYYDYQIFNTYIDHFAENAVLILPISIFSLYNSMDSFEAIEPVYYRLLDEDHIYNCSLKKLFLFKYVPVLSAKKNFTEAMIAKENPPSYFVPNGTLKSAEFSKHGKLRMETHINISNNQQLDKTNVDALQNIIELCKTKNITPVIITTPTTKYYTDYLSKEFASLFYNDLQNTIGTDVLYLNYLSDPRFNNSTNLFCDSDHLNQAGREKFSDVLFNDLVELGIL